MSQAEIQITDTPPLPGVQLVQELNDAFQAVATDFAGDVDPAAFAFPYSLWAHTSTGELKRRNDANSAWVVVGRIFPDAAPAFYAFKSADQSLTNATRTKITFDVEPFDTNSNYATSRFTPTVAGYYQLSAGISWGGAASGVGIVFLDKNGGQFKVGSTDPLDFTANTSVLSVLVYANGTTDYFEIYGTQHSGTTLAAVSGESFTYFTGALVRAA